MARRIAVGMVTSDKMHKTRRVELPRQVRHAKYGKYMRTQTVCFVHDEEEASHTGDKVEIQECRALSKRKRWKLVRVVAKSQAVDVAALRALEKARAEAEESETSDSDAGEG